MTFRFVITGAPRTKKTHNQLAGLSTGRPRVLPSKQFRQWLKDSLWQVPEIKQSDDGRLLLWPRAEWVSVKALIYRDRNSGDVVGFYQAIGDFLQAKSGAAGFIQDDKQIAHWDGSRLLIDREHPRLDITLEWPA